MFLIGYPGVKLLPYTCVTRLFQKHSLLECHATAAALVEIITRDLLKNWDGEVARLLVKSVRHNWRFEGIFKAVWRGFLRSWSAAGPREFCCVDWEGCKRSV